MKANIAALGLTLITAVTGCGVADNSGDSETGFALGKDWQHSSLLNHIAKNGSLTICLGFADGTYKSQDEQRFTTAIKKAVAGWNDLLVGMTNPAWERKIVTVKIAARESLCPASSDVDVNVWQTTDAWDASQGTDRRSHASIGDMAMDLDPEDFHGTRGTGDLNFTVRHEYGHLLGLGDTYVIEGRNEPIDQPAATMKYYGEPFQPDDRAGIRAMWRYVKTGVADCGSGYTTGEFANDANYWNYLFCVPE